MVEASDIYILSYLPVGEVHFKPVIFLETNTCMIMENLFSILILCITFLTLSQSITMNGSERDRLALLAIKSQIHDPTGITTSWNSSISVCDWNGVKCGPRHQRVTHLDLSFQNLGGSLSPAIGNLSFLRVVYLQENKISGKIPIEVGKLSRLRILYLSNNTFTGIIPLNLSNCYNLVELDIGGNNLVGKIPEQLGYLSKLKALSIFGNYLIGELPGSIGNLSHLERLDIGMNGLRGRIPEAIGQLRSLWVLELDQNSFSGTIPPSIYNISSLEYFQVMYNQLHGVLPQNIAFNLPNLKWFSISHNNFSGPIPKSIVNASKIYYFDINNNQFTGKVSLDFSALKNLGWLNFGNNSLGSGSLEDLDFLTSLNSSRLELIGLYLNRFGGTLKVANLPATMEKIVLGGNLISGAIPPGIAKLTNLVGLGLQSNQLTGPIPETIGNLTKLVVLSFSANNISGTIPFSIGNLTSLTKLYLESNNLQGSIPSSLGMCKNLLDLDLSHNRLTGDVPQEILSITTLSIVLNLSNNHLTGRFPFEDGNLKSLVALDLSKNQFHGLIYAALGSWVSMEHLNLSGNSFNGSIPQALNSLQSIKILDLSHNRFSVEIPKYFQNLSLLQSLNLSYNHFEGGVPTDGIFKNATAVSLTDNEKLCGGLAEFHLPSCQIKRSKRSKLELSLKLILIACAVVGGVLLLLVLLCWYKKKGKKETSLPSFSRISILQLSYQQLLKATNGFSLANLLGAGSFGSVYKGILEEEEDSNVVAVKVINLQHKGASKSFIAECEALRNIRHRNLVKVISACSSIDFQGNSFKAVIYEFFPNGSLDKWLHILPRETEANSEPRGLSFLQRLNIAIDVASAIGYLHHHSQFPIIHCDVKPSNVLLDDDMVAHLGDFGLVKFFPKASENQTSSLGLKGTIGYAAPEYAMGSEASTRGDMYSFGILILEMFTGKRPTDDALTNGVNLHNFTKMALPMHVTQIVDPYILYKASEDDNNRNPTHSQMMRNKMQEWLISIFEIGIASSVESPKDRMDISDATRVLCLIKDEFFKLQICSTKQG